MTYPQSEGMSEIHNEIRYVLPLIKQIREERKSDYSLSYIYVIFLISIAGLVFNYKSKNNRGTDKLPSPNDKNPLDEERE